MANILVIDDDRDIRPMMQMLLTRLGHTPAVAARGEEGFISAVNNKFDLVILDLMMPDIDGFEVTRRLRADARTKDLPILIFTARTQLPDQEGAMEAGADGYLTKPVDPRELTNKINQLLTNRPVRPALSSAQTSGPMVAATPATSLPFLANLTPPSATPAAPAPVGPLPPLTLAPTSRVSVILGLRGGAGATTLATNLAGTLSRNGKRVCLIDLSPVGSEVALQLRLRPKNTWADLPPAPDANTVGQMLVRYDTGLFILNAPTQPVRRSLSGETFHAILSGLSGFFSEIVIDGSPMLDDATMLALNVAKCALVVLTPEVVAVQMAVGTMRALNTLGILDTSLQVALNQVTPETGIPQTAVELALGRPVDLVIPFDRGQSAALTQGTPLAFIQPVSPLPTAIRSFVAKF